MALEEFIRKMKAPNDPRPTWRNGVIQIHITRACDESCINCTQGSNLGGKPNMMTPEQFELAVRSLKGYEGVIGIFGGNPTLHPKFKDICEILERDVPFEQRGLWSNNLNGHGTLCKRVFNPAVSNLNVHTRQENYDEMKRDWPECNPIGLEFDSHHSPVFVSMTDLGIENEEQKRLISKCDINQLWSALIGTFRGELRGWFCEIAGAQSMLHQNDPSYPDTGMPIFKGWYKLPMDSFVDQVYKHCFECSVPLKLKGDLAVKGQVNSVSKVHLPIYNLKNKKQTIQELTELPSEKVDRATDYISEGVKMDGGNSLEKVKIVIGLPTAEMARRADFYDYFNQIMRPEGTYIVSTHGQSPARGRNIIIEDALNNNATHVFFIDDDVLIPSDALMKLLNHNKDIVTGLYLMRNFPHRPIIFNKAEANGSCHHHFLNGNGNDLIEIVAAGLGCCLIKTEVFKKLEKPWVRLGQLEMDHWCDDIDFFRRARDAGFKSYCDTTIKAGHISTVTLWPHQQDGNWFTAYDSGGPNKPIIPAPKSYED